MVRRKWTKPCPGGPRGASLYLEKSGAAISRAEAQQRMFQKLVPPTFFTDMRPLLSTNRARALTEETLKVASVMTELIDRIPGDEWAKAGKCGNGLESRHPWRYGCSVIPRTSASSSRPRAPARARPDRFIEEGRSRADPRRRALVGDHRCAPTVWARGFRTALVSS